MTVSPSTVWLDKNDKVNVISSPGLISSSFTWETVKTINFGVDVTALNNRLQMTFDYYKAPVINAGENVVAAPVAPTIKDCTPEDAEYSWFTITLSAKTKDGKDLDAEKLYYNMVEAKATWLYELPQWDAILTPHD